MKKERGEKVNIFSLERKKIQSTLNALKGGREIVPKHQSVVKTGLAGFLVLKGKNMFSSSSIFIYLEGRKRTFFSFPTRHTHSLPGRFIKLPFFHLPLGGGGVGR
jgi:hypothetical protein